MNRIIYIADPEILAIPVQECNEAFIDVKEKTEILYGPIPECEATKDCYTKMRTTVFQKLCAAQKDLPHGWRFRLYEGFRSLAVQQMLFDYEYARVKQRIPNADPKEIFHETTRLVSPVINVDGSKNVPPHNTGAAVDVEIINADGKLVDMGMIVAETWNVDPEICMTECTSISDTARQNRKILYDVMYAHDFINYPTEWWHFSYGDRYWAYHKKQAHAIYGSADQLLVV